MMDAEIPLQEILKSSVYLEQRGMEMDFLIDSFEKDFKEIEDEIKTVQV